MTRHPHLGLVILLLLMTACAVVMNPGATAMTHISVGMSRAEALTQLSDAWHTDECPATTKNGELLDRRDLFWYGPMDVTKANVIVVVYTFSTTQEVWIVDRFEMAENYLLDDFYGDCVTLDISPLTSPTLQP